MLRCRTRRPRSGHVGPRIGRRGVPDHVPVLRRVDRVAAGRGRHRGPSRAGARRTRWRRWLGRRRALTTVQALRPVHLPTVGTPDGSWAEVDLDDQLAPGAPRAVIADSDAGRGLAGGIWDSPQCRSDWSAPAASRRFHRSSRSRAAMVTRVRVGRPRPDCRIFGPRVCRKADYRVRRPITFSTDGGSRAGTRGMPSTARIRPQPP
jgi:hypothetical protein